ncbi:MAG: translation initiation factor IF-2 [Deltaproteobacteria bacterium]|jgi:translation initiation factor IF-2|nr:translation initiation factor IF-2 [Deltaproteobacteria bacterium]
MGKKRIHELAKELSMSSGELLRRIAELKILPGQKLGASNSIEDNIAEEIKRLVKVQLRAGVKVVRRRKNPEAEIQPQTSSAAAPATEKSEAPAPVHKESPKTVEKTIGSKPQAPAEKKPVKIRQRTFEKATIVGTSPVRPKEGGRESRDLRDSRSRGYHRDKNAQPLPDFIKLRPQVASDNQAPGSKAAEALGAQEGANLEAVGSAQEGALAGQKEASLESRQEAAKGQKVASKEAAKETEAPGSAGKKTQKGSGLKLVEAPQTTQAPKKPSGSGGGVGSGYAIKVGHIKELRNQQKAAQNALKETQDDTTSFEPAKVVGMKTSWTPKTEFIGEKPKKPAVDSESKTKGAAPGKREDRVKEGVGATETDGRPKRDKKKRGGYTDHLDEGSMKLKRREVVERTDLYSDGAWERARTKKSKASKKTHSKTEITVPKAIKRRIKVDEAITVAELAHRLSLKVGDIIKKLMGLGVIASVNQSLDFETAVLVSAEFGYEVEKSSFDEEELITSHGLEDTYAKLPRSPVVTIMGHVDHGKTSLLDYIRKSKVQEGEAGGITQHIGAYHVAVGDRYITFLDTPGHEAFTSMRSRGAQVTDIVILIVAADDGVMPQTREAADHAKAAKVPIIVAVNKIDKPGADTERIRRQMMELGLTQEAWGGDTVFCDISAKTGQGVQELLEMILLQADILNLTARTEGPARGRIIEARLDRGRGAVATLLVREGTLNQGDSYVCGVFYGKLRALLNDDGQRVDAAGPSIPVEIQGISGVPQAGDEFIVMEDEKQARQVSQHRQSKLRENVLVKTSKLTLENLFDHIKAGAVKGLNLIIKADVQGSLEAILDAVNRLSTPEIKVTVLHSATGAVTETDIMLAAASSALVICFGLKPAVGRVQDVAEQESVQVRYYDVIYKLLDDLKEAMAGLLDPVKSEALLGWAEVRQVFTITKVGQIAGSLVTSGKLLRGAKVRIHRDKDIVYEGKISTLKREKSDVREVLEGYECGIGFENFGGFAIGDRVECFQVEETAATVELINQAVERERVKAETSKHEPQEKPAG